MKIEFPWPPKQLSPNYKNSHHWSKSSSRAKRYKNTCWALTLEAMGRKRAFPAPLPVKITFVPPDNRRRDRDNMIGQFKAGQDGMAKALGIDDRHLEPTYSFSQPCKPGCVVVEICA